MSGSSSPSEENIRAGVYESVLTDRLLELIKRIEESRVVRGPIDVEEAPKILSAHIAEATRKRLNALSPEKQLDLVNSIVDILRDADAALPGSSPEQLFEIKQTSGQLVSNRPTSGLNAMALLTNSRDEPNLGAEIRLEMSTSSSVDLLSAFIRWHGLRVIEKQLLELKSRGIRMRVLTTTYMGATEKRALDELVNRFGADVRVNYEHNSTRLHAKAWMFRRQTGFNTAYVGSSNLSHSALVEGLEWNVRISETESPSLMRKFEATFESYWNDPTFEEYLPHRDGDKLAAALSGPSEKASTPNGLDTGLFSIRPLPHQDQILEALQSERETHDRHRNLVIAATGTGKTVVAALDYARLFETLGDYPSLLFVAHRREILDQSRQTYRAVLLDGEFGEQLYDGKKPSAWKHVFASVQSLSLETLRELNPGAFDVIVIDEFHHAEAETYRRILDHFHPRELLGLTATPERGDGVDVREEFFGGRAAAEIRLWNALDADLLVPFHYFGINDEVDLSGAGWSGTSGYDASDLTEIYTGETGYRRAGLILKAIEDKVTDPLRMKALGFCASVRHAEYMSEAFNEAGIPTGIVTGKTPSETRRELLRKLRHGEINCLMAVDVFNEGLDIPQIDTVIMLRPTQSPTVFLQQLGRGLRRAPNKAVLTVLDFIGMHRAEFRFDRILRAMTGLTRSRLLGDIANGFPFLPAGSQIVLDRVVQERVIENVRAKMKLNRGAMVDDVRSYLTHNPDLDLAGYLVASSREIREVYSKTTWSEIRHQLGLAKLTEDEHALSGRMKSFIHVDDSERAEAFAALLAADGPNENELSATDRQYASMLLAILWPGSRFTSVDVGLTRLRGLTTICSEIKQILNVTSDASRRVARPMGGSLAPNVLKSHATYRREEILAALGWESGFANHVSGVAWCAETQTDALLITLHKSDKRFSPTTMYHDYALSPELFHWDSQNATSELSEVGRRYIGHEANGSNVVLFSRDVGTDTDGFTGAYVCLGRAIYVKHIGNKPMSITWQLERSMPADIFLSASAVAR
jgi:superfamily II DNA or RNA helicase/HKD family nuclease